MIENKALNKVEWKSRTHKANPVLMDKAQRIMMKMIVFGPPVQTFCAGDMHDEDWLMAGSWSHVDGFK